MATTPVLEPASRLTVDDDFANMEDVNEMSDNDGPRPHEAIDSFSQRDTPIKRNALAVKQKGTFRQSRNGSPKNNQRHKKQSSFASNALI